MSPKSGWKGRDRSTGRQSSAEPRAAAAVQGVQKPQLLLTGVHSAAMMVSCFNRPAHLNSASRAWRSGASQRVDALGFAGASASVRCAACQSALAAGSWEQGCRRCQAICVQTERAGAGLVMAACGRKQLCWAGQPRDKPRKSGLRQQGRQIWGIFTSAGPSPSFSKIHAGILQGVCSVGGAKFWLRRFERVPGPRPGEPLALEALAWITRGATMPVHVSRVDWLGWVAGGLHPTGTSRLLVGVQKGLCKFK